MDILERLLLAANLHALWIDALHPLAGSIEPRMLKELDQLPSWDKTGPAADRDASVSEIAFLVLVAIAYAKLCFDLEASARDQRSQAIAAAIASERKVLDDKLVIAARSDEIADELAQRRDDAKYGSEIAAMRLRAKTLRDEVERDRPAVEARAADAVAVLRREPHMTFESVLAHWDGFEPEWLPSNLLGQRVPPLCDQNWTNLYRTFLDVARSYGDAPAITRMFGV